MSQVIAATRLADFSHVIFALWEKCYSLKPDEFVDFIFAQIEKLIPCDSGYWGGGRVYPQEEGWQAVIHFHHLYRQTPAYDEVMTPEFLRNNNLVMRCFETLGTSQIFAVDEVTGFPPSHCSALHALGIRQILSLYFADINNQVVRVFSLYRNSAANFSKEDRLLHQILAPHVYATYRTAMIASLAGPGYCRGGIALTDRQGSIHFAAPLFAELIQLEWPGWQGPDLPAALQAGFAVNRDRHVGPALVVQRLPAGKLFSVEVRRRCALDDLTEREKDIARRFALGEDYKTVARAVSISPATVRNHLSNIYRKLGISDKAELVALMQQI